MLKSALLIAYVYTRYHTHMHVSQPVAFVFECPLINSATYLLHCPRGSTGSGRGGGKDLCSGLFSPEEKRTEQLA